MYSENALDFFNQHIGTEWVFKTEKNRKQGFESTV